MIKFILTACLTLLGSLALSGCIAVFSVRRRLAKAMVKFLNSRKWYENLNLAKKIGWPDFFEALLRAENGEPISRPFGSPVHRFDLHQIHFVTGYYSRKPLDDHIPVDTSVVLGPRAKRPLTLEIPILLGAMSYGNSFSIPTKFALARAVNLAGTGFNSGNGPFLQEIKDRVDRYILQLPRGFWSRHESILKQAQLIEIGLGHAAWASAPIRIKGYKLTPDFAQRIGTIPGLDLLIDTHLPKAEHDDLAGFVRYLKSVTGGVPVAFKFGATHYLEKELEIMAEAGADMIAFDGSEGGTHGSPPIFQDHTGLPFFPALCRAARFFEKNGLKGRVSLVVGGGLVNPGDFLKCLALGADAVFIGTAATLLITHTQVTKSIPWEPPTELLFFGGKDVQKFDPNLGGDHLYHYLQSCVREMVELTRLLGKDSLRKVDREDLVALDSLYAEMAGINCHMENETERTGIF